MKRLISRVLVVIFIVNIIALAGCNKNNDRVAINISTDVPGYVLTQGEKTKVVVNKSYINGNLDEVKGAKLESTNDRIFEVNDGKIIAKKKGNAFLKVKYKGNEIKVPVSVFENSIAADYKLSKEKLIEKTFEEKYKKIAIESANKPIISAFQVGNDVKIIWNYPKGFKKFKLFKSKNDNNGYEKIYEGKVGKNNDEYIDKA